VLSVDSVGLPSIVMRGDHGEVRCCGLSKVWNGLESGMVLDQMIFGVALRSCVIYSNPFVDDSLC
jgi:hypothetical protein